MSVSSMISATGAVRSSWVLMTRHWHGGQTRHPTRGAETGHDSGARGVVLAGLPPPREARPQGETRTMTTTHPADDHALIRVEGARENNLKNVSVELPKRRLTVFTGVSGSGKS